MKNLNNLGSVLSKTEQKSINGGQIAIDKRWCTEF